MNSGSGILNNIASISMGQSPPGVSVNSTGDGLPLLNGPTEFGFKYPRPTQYTTKPQRFAKKGDILFCVRGSTTGRMNWADQDYAIGRGLAALRHKSSLELQPYLKAILEYKLPNLLSQTTGSTFPNISRDQLNNLQISNIKIEEQTRISSVISAYDKLIENNEKRIKILEEMAQRLYTEWFVKFKFPGHEKVKMIDSPLGKIPEGWEIKKIIDICEIKYGKNLPAKLMLDDGKYPVYGAAKVIGRFNEFTRDSSTVITGCRGSVGKITITEPFSFITNNSLTFNFSEGEKFFFYYQLTKRSLTDVISGSAQPQITIESLSNVKLFVPPKELILSFVKEVKLTKDLSHSLKVRNIVLSGIRDLLIPQLVTGRRELR